MTPKKDASPRHPSTSPGGEARPLGAPIPSFVSRRAEGCSVALHVQPRASRTQWAGIHGGAALKLRLQAPPVDGKANEELIRFLADYFGVPRSAVSILSGQSGRDKCVLIAGAAPEDIVERLSRGGAIP